MELALLLPWLLLMIDGVAELGVLMYNQSVLTSASSMAARAGIGGGGSKLSPAAIGQLALNYCNANLLLAASSTIPSVEVVQAGEPSFQLPLQVTVRYTYQGLLIGGFLAALQTRPAMQASTVMYNE
jgi:Flp pilus assembly protein TadG